MIEVIATTPGEAKMIESCGADRIELVTSISEGGLTPSYGAIEKAVGAVRVPVNVMIRPHSKTFCYTRDEIEVMKRDIKVARELGASGVVVGVLKSGRIDEEALKYILEACEGLTVTFHRAMDETEDILKSLDVISKYRKITDVLTSGGRRSILENTNVIREMIKRSKNVRVMVGGGLTFENIKKITAVTNAEAYHFGRAVRRNNSPFGEIEEEKLVKMVNFIKGMMNK
jgi:copper homeostasis protein